MVIGSVIENDIEDSTENQNNTNLKRLWQSVIVQAIRDSRARVDRAEVSVDKHRAISWLKHGGHDFNMVCELAGIEPTMIKRGMK